MDVSLGTKFAFGIYCVVIAMMGAFGNIGLLYAILSNKKSRTILANIHLITLAIADLLTCIIVVPFLLISLDLPEYEKSHEDEFKTPCRVAIFFVYCSGVKRVLALTVMSVDRYIAIIHPFFYHRNFRPITALIVNIFIAIQGIATNLPMPLMPEWVAYEGKLGSPCGFKWEGKLAYLIVYFLLNFVFPCIILITTNIKVFVIARKQRNRIVALQQRHAIADCSRNVFGMPSVDDGQSTSTPQLGKREILSTANSPAVIMKQTRVAELRSDSLDSNRSNDSGINARNHESLPRTTTSISFIYDNTPSLTRKKLRLAFTEQPNNAVNGQEQSAIGNCIESQMRNIRKRAYIQDLTISFSTLILVLLFIITYFPFALSRLLFVADKKFFSWTIVAVTSSLTILSAGLNSIIVIGTRSDLRRTIKAKLLRIFRCCSRNT